MLKRHESNKRKTKNPIITLKMVFIKIALKQINVKTQNLGNIIRTLELTLRPVSPTNYER